MYIIISKWRKKYTNKNIKRFLELHFEYKQWRQVCNYTFYTKYITTSVKSNIVCAYHMAYMCSRPKLMHSTTMIKHDHLQLHTQYMVNVNPMDYDCESMIIYNYTQYVVNVNPMDYDYESMIIYNCTHSTWSMLIQWIMTMKVWSFTTAQKVHGQC